jgi:hypothetical protein
VEDLSHGRKVRLGAETGVVVEETASATATAVLGEMVVLVEEVQAVVDIRSGLMRRGRSGEITHGVVARAAVAAAAVVAIAVPGVAAMVGMEAAAAVVVVVEMEEMAETAMVRVLTEVAEMGVAAAAAVQEMAAVEIETLLAEAETRVAEVELAETAAVVAVVVVAAAVAVAETTARMDIVQLTQPHQHCTMPVATSRGRQQGQIITMVGMTTSDTATSVGMPPAGMPPATVAGTGIMPELAESENQRHCLDLTATAATAAQAIPGCQGMARVQAPAAAITPHINKAGRDLAHLLVAVGMAIFISADQAVVVIWGSGLPIPVDLRIGTAVKAVVVEVGVA